MGLLTSCKQRVQPVAVLLLLLICFCTCFLPAEVNRADLWPVCSSLQKITSELTKDAIHSELLLSRTPLLARQFDGLSRKVAVSEFCVLVGESVFDFAGDYIGNLALSPGDTEAEPFILKESSTGYVAKAGKVWRFDLDEERTLQQFCLLPSTVTIEGRKSAIAHAQVLWADDTSCYVCLTALETSGKNAYVLLRYSRNNEELKTISVGSQRYYLASSAQPVFACFKTTSDNTPPSTQVFDLSKKNPRSFQMPGVYSVAFNNDASLAAHICLTEEQPQEGRTYEVRVLRTEDAEMLLKVSLPGSNNKPLGELPEPDMTITPRDAGTLPFSRHPRDPRYIHVHFDKDGALLLWREKSLSIIEDVTTVPRVTNNSFLGRVIHVNSSSLAFVEDSALVRPIHPTSGEDAYAGRFIRSERVERSKRIAQHWKMEVLSDLDVQTGICYVLTFGQLIAVDIRNTGNSVMLEAAPIISQQFTLTGLKWDWFNRSLVLLAEKEVNDYTIHASLSAKLKVARDGGFDVVTEWGDVQYGKNAVRRDEICSQWVACNASVLSSMRKAGLRGDVLFSTADAIYVVTRETDSEALHLFAPKTAESVRLLQVHGHIAGILGENKAAISYSTNPSEVSVVNLKTLKTVANHKLPLLYSLEFVEPDIIVVKHGGWLTRGVVVRNKGDELELTRLTPSVAVQELSGIMLARGLSIRGSIVQSSFLVFLEQLKANGEDTELMAFANALFSK